MQKTRGYWMGALLAVAAAGAAGAQDSSWIKLFDGESTFGWTALGDAQWSVSEGVLTGSQGSGGALVSTSQFADFELKAKIRVKAGSSSGLLFRGALDGHPSENGSGVVWLREKKDSKPPWREVQITAQGPRVNVSVDGETAQNIDLPSRAKGHVAILYHHNGGATVEVSELQLRPLGLTPIFNGKNLDGWNIIPGHQSEFNVVDGALNVTDGNGQIETAAVYKDFLLQLEIISKGTHLNSGVFYRGPVGEFWKGYESQVRNQWRGGDRTRPVDFGTGGNYGNQPARRVVSSDHEWFTKTLVCEGNHTAVWINGYQVSDFYDTRAVNRRGNGKEGYVPGPGTIHLQGHDPTTDLSFKNIGIQPYPAP